MNTKRLQTIGLIFVFLLIAELLIVRRFDMPQQEPVTIIAKSGSTRQIGSVLKRGEIIKTSTGEYLLLKIGNNVRVGIDERSQLELYRLYEDERILRFPRGRIVIDNPESTPIIVETKKTENTINQARAILINFDFLQSVTIAPIRGSIQTYLKGTKEWLLLPAAISVNEKDTPSFSASTSNPEEGAPAVFHAWINSQFMD